MSTGWEVVDAALARVLDMGAAVSAVGYDDDPLLLREPDVERFYERRCVVLETDLRGKAELIADAVLCLHEAGDHENADRIERLGASF